MAPPGEPTGGSATTLTATAPGQAQTTLASVGDYLFIASVTDNGIPPTAPALTAVLTRTVHSVDNLPPALIITAGDAATDPVPMVRSVLGPVGIAGGVTTGVFTEAGIASRGVLVVAFATEGDAASGAACVGARDLADAGRSAARLVMAGWPFRLRYPRGLGLTFTSAGSPLSFLTGELVAREILIGAADSHAAHK